MDDTVILQQRGYFASLSRIAVVIFVSGYERIFCLRPGRGADLLIAYALRFGCNTGQNLMSSALSAMKLMPFDVMDIQHPAPNVTSASTAKKPFNSILA